MTQPTDPITPAPRPVDVSHQLPAPGQDAAHGGGSGGGPGNGHPGEGVPSDLAVPGALTIIFVVSLFVALLALLFVAGFIPSHREEVKTRSDAVDRAKARPVAQWLRPTISNGEKDVVLPCDVTAYQQTAVFTRTNGYLQEWHYDIGQPVKAGQLMAVIATPEVDAQLSQSKATLEQNRANVVKAQADLDLAKKTLDRYVESQRTSPGSVTKEQIDQQQAAYEDAVAALKQVQASVTQAEANVQQLQTQVDFERVMAPFSGTVTARNYDVGALLSPPNSTSVKEIFDLAETDKLRVFVNVPQTYANNVKRGQIAYLAVRNFPGKEFAGRVSLTAGAVDPNTRTLRVQIDFLNPKDELFAGEYGQVRLPVTPQLPVAVIRSASLVFNAAGTEVAVYGPDNHVHIKQVALGRDLGTELQVTSGLTADDRVIINPGERTTEGADVDGREAAHESTTKPTTNPAIRQVDESTLPKESDLPTTAPGGNIGNVGFSTTRPAAGPRPEPTTRSSADAGR